MQYSLSLHFLHYHYWHEGQMLPQANMLMRLREPIGGKTALA